MRRGVLHRSRQSVDWARHAAAGSWRMRAAAATPLRRHTRTRQEGKMAQTSLATAGQIAWRLLELHGLDAAALFKEQGIALDVLRDSNARIASHKWDALTRRAAELSPNPGFALVTGQCWHPSNLGALGFAWLSSSTLRTGLQRVVRYWKLVGERSAPRLVDLGTAVKLVFETGRADPVISGHLADFNLSLLFSMCRMNFGDGLHPLELTMKYVWPGEREAYERHFGCAVVSNAPEDSITFAASDLDRSLPSANRQIAATLDRVLVEQLAHLDKTNVVARAKAALLEQLSGGELSEQEMAEALHMSRRTLQRKLAEAEVTYQRLVDETRRDLALRYVEDPRNSIIDITFMLGFSQQSAFTRAFKRWTGSAPSEYRQRLKTAAAQAAS
jgi:AraC-like DNA-binding protein